MSGSSPQWAGVLNVLKPPGLTSHGLVLRVRRLLGIRAVGHGGTLDPGAAGVLPVLVGAATKLMPYLLDHPKRYRAEMTLGIATDTQDASGRPLRVAADFALDPAALTGVITSFVGTIEQVPPMTSAVRVGGERLYERARRGESVERPPRRVEIYDLRVLAIWPPGSGTLVQGTRVLLEVTCSKGTYVRTLCHDIGERLGCGAHMSFLVRTDVGPLTLSESFTLEELAELHAKGRLAECFLPLETALSHLPRVEVGAAEAARLRQGVRRPVDPGRIQGSVDQELVAAVETGRGLVCVARLVRSRERLHLQPVRVFS